MDDFIQLISRKTLFSSYNVLDIPNDVNTHTGEGLRITRPGGGHIMFPLLSQLPEKLETQSLRGE